MKIKDSLKKGLMLGLASIIGADSAHAGYADDILGDSITNVTSASSFVETDPSTGEITRSSYYSGGVSFRFGPSMSYPEPIINLSGPKLSAGCSGLSIKGMFGSIISLDRFGDMLKNAGASLAWGIVVGLIYSLPGIGAAFKMINNWAKKIQQLLANACQSGIAMTQSLMKDTGMKDRLQDNWLSHADNYVSGLDQPLKTKLREAGISNHFNDDMTYGMPDDDKPTTEDIKANYRQLLIGAIAGISMSTNVLSGLTTKLASTTALDFIYDVFGVTSISDIKDMSSTGLEIYLDSLPVTGSGTTQMTVDSIISKYGSALSETDKGDLARSFMGVAISRYLVGDIIFQGQKQFEKDLKTAYDLLEEIDNPGQLTEDQIHAKEDALKDMIQGTNIAFGFVSDNQNSDRSHLFAKRLVRFLYSGTTSLSSSTAVESRFSIPALSYGAIALPAPAEDNQDASKTIVFFGNPKFTQTNSFIGSTSGGKGAYIRSWDMIAELTGTTKPDGTMGGGLRQDFSKLEASVGIPLLIPGVLEKIRILQESSYAVREDYVKILAQINAIEVVKSALGGFLTGGLMSTPEPALFFVKGGEVTRVAKKVSISPERRRQFAAQISKASDMKVLLEPIVMNELGRITHRDVTSFTTLKDLEAEFKILNDNNIKRTIKQTPGK